jgi:hypothetical protein
MLFCTKWSCFFGLNKVFIFGGIGYTKRIEFVTRWKKMIDLEDFQEELKNVSAEKKKVGMAVSYKKRHFKLQVNLNFDLNVGMKVLATITNLKMRPIRDGLGEANCLFPKKDFEVWFGQGWREALCLFGEIKYLDDIFQFVPNEDETNLLALGNVCRELVGTNFQSDLAYKEKNLREHIRAKDVGKKRLIEYDFPVDFEKYEIS